MIDVPALETPRLRMRGWRNGDLDGYAPMCADAEVMRYIGTGATQTRNEAWRAMSAFLGHWALRGFGMWALERKDTGVLVGRAGFIEPEGWPGFELGWLLGREHWGHGYAVEAGRAALDWGRESLKRDRVISLIRPENTRSIKVAERLGESFREEIAFLGGKARVYELRLAPR
jgi:RimJ/RimL family protein N-acetyltransferase